MHQRILGPLLILSLALLAVSAANARFVSPWSIDRIAKEAKLIAVGGVLETAPGAAPSREEKGYWLRDVHAQVRILRVFASGESSAPAIGDSITLWYEEYDLEKFVGVMNGFLFPDLKPGDCFAFPLTRTPTDGEERWTLLDRENFGLLVPCIRQKPEGPAAQTTEDFLLAELANVFARGAYDDLNRAAHYMHNDLTNTTFADRLCERLVPIIKEDEARWLDIALAAYNSMGTPRPTISQVVKGEETLRSQSALAHKAFSHVRTGRLDESIIETTISHASSDPSGSSNTLVDNYLHHPTTLRLVKEQLRVGDAAAIEIADSLIRNDDKPDPALVELAVKAALRSVTGPMSKPYWRIRSACSLILNHGSDSQFGELLNVVKKTLTEDHEKFFALWQGLAYTENKREMAVIRIAIEDDSSAPRSDFRVCDSAVSQLQRITGEDFGATVKGTQADRDKAVRKAKDWLAKHS